MIRFIWNLMLFFMTVEGLLGAMMTALGKPAQGIVMSGTVVWGLFILRHLARKYPIKGVNDDA